MKKFKIQKTERIVTILSAVIVGLCLYIVTPYGLALSPDSVGYLKGAEGLITGEGLNYFNVQWPPIYPFLIALVSWISDVNVIDGARLLNSLLLALLFLILTNNNHKKNKFLNIIFAIELLIHPVLTHIYFYAWSELLLIIILILNINCLSRLSKEDVTNEFEFRFLNTNLIVLSILAVMTRYAGITIFITNIIVILVYLKKISIWNRAKIIIIHSSFFIFFVGSWFVFTYLNFKTFTNRTATFHPPTIHQIENGLAEIGRWYLPIYFKLSNFICTGLGILLIIYILKYFLKWNQEINKNFDSKVELNDTQIYLLFILVYLIFILISISFIDAATPLDSRILSPIFVSIAICFLLKLEKTHIRFYLKVLVTIYILIITYSSVIDLKYWSMLSKFNGIELSSKEYSSDNINQLIKNCDRKVRIISDAPWELDLYTKAKVDWLPREFDMTSGLPNREYKNQIKNILDMYQIIVVRNLNSKYITEFNMVDRYTKLISTERRILWINKEMGIEQLCGLDIDKKY